MIILYTDRQGGEWIPFNTPMSVELIRVILPPLGYGMAHLYGALPCPPAGYQPGHVCERQHGTFFVPQSDMLPILHSILLPTAARWDAEDRQWTFYRYGDDFKAWWEKYIAHYKPGRESQEYFWLDQGPGWSQHGLRTAEEALERAIATGGPIPDLTRGLFSERQEFGFKPRS